MKFSANLGFLWAELPLPDAIRAAHRAGFDAVECHWPFDTPAGVTRDALQETGLPMLGLNTRRGNVAAGENGLAALPGREAEARAAIDEALAYARATGTAAVHVMAGRTDDPRAEDTFLANLAYACHAAEPDGITILIEPLNPHDAPGYFLKDTAQAVRLIQTLDHPRLRLMFDCYHVARVEGDVCARFAAVRPLIGHVQIAGVPARGRPDRGDVDYGSLLPSLGWPGPIGAEYRPGGATEDSLGWLALWRGR